MKATRSTRRPLLPYDLFVACEDEWYTEAEQLMAERDVRSNGTMSQLALYAEIAYLRAGWREHEQT